MYRVNRAKIAGLRKKQFALQHELHRSHAKLREVEEQLGEYEEVKINLRKKFGANMSISKKRKLKVMTSDGPRITSKNVAKYERSLREQKASLELQKENLSELEEGIDLKAVERYKELEDKIVEINDDFESAQSSLGMKKH